ncbi:MAG: CehA/McbA family metallohydrolase [Gemmataceae bacterium]
MSARIRRCALALVSVVLMIVVAASQKQAEPPRHLLRVAFGLKDKKSTDWSGKVEISGGKIVSLTGWRFEEKDAVDGVSGWKCRTHEQIALGEHYPMTSASGELVQPPKQPGPNGVTFLVSGEAPALTLTLPTGEIKFKSEDISLGEPRMYLDGQVRVERLPDTSVPRPAAAPKAVNPVQDDYPAYWVGYKSGKHYLAWVSYRQEKDRVLLAEREGPDGVWSEPREAAGPGDHYRVALASTHGDTLWIVWASQREHNWDLFARPYRDGKLGKEIRLTDDAGPDIWHTMTTDQRGRAWLVWQGFRAGQADIFARCVDGDGWHETIRVSTAQANDWNPVVAADPKSDRVWVGWDTYENGDYGIRVRALSGGPTPKLGAVLCPDNSPVFQAHPSLACDRAGRLWVAWDQSGPQWGKDAGYQVRDNAGTRLYHDRRLRVACLTDGKWQEPEADLLAALPSELRTFSELPCLQGDTEGRMWLAFRHRTCQYPRVDDWATRGRWDVFAAAFLGDRWSGAIALPSSAGRNDMRLSSQRDPKESVYFAYASDNRGWFPPGALTEKNLSVAVSRLHGAGRPAEVRLRDLSPPTAPPDGGGLRGGKRIHPREAEQVKRIRAYKVESGGRTYRIHRGDMHRHTDISSDGVGDGTLMDLHRYALDAAALDFIVVTDHNMGGDKEYPWWRTQKANDLYTLPNTFISMYGYERSVPYPNGHRNVLWTERGQRTLPLPRPGIAKQMAEDTPKLYDYLRRTGGICTLHTSATDQGTNWAEHDDALEPVVELFQGYDSSYEAPGAPRTIDDKSVRIHGRYRPAGFVSLALDKGYRLGFQSSSDHVSTHISYACILAEEFSRKGLIEALKKRHSYAATDNIVLDVRMGANIMGDEVRTNKPSLDVVVLGTNALESVDVLRDGEVVHTFRPEKENAEAKFRWDDPAPKKGNKASYYYVRVVQKDRQMAWSSPIWVRN